MKIPSIFASIMVYSAVFFRGSKNNNAYYLTHLPKFVHRFYAVDEMYGLEFIHCYPCLIDQKNNKIASKCRLIK